MAKNRRAAGQDRTLGTVLLHDSPTTLEGSPQLTLGLSCSRQNPPP